MADQERTEAERYALACQLFDQLCELSGAGREAALARASERDPEVAALTAEMLDRDAAAGAAVAIEAFEG